MRECEVKIKGVGKVLDGVVKKGINEDGLEELYVEEMDLDLVLLSANQYARKGAVILFGEDGVVLQMTEEEKEILREHIKSYEMTKKLEVENSTYRVLYEVIDEEEQCAMLANTYFNTKVNVSNEEERILAYMLSGLTWEMLREALDKQLFTGLHPNITKSLLERFSRKWGKSPDILQMAHPNITGNAKGYMSERDEVKEVGYLQADFMSFDFNEVGESVNTRESIIGGKKTKLKTLGGAIAAFVVVDKFSRYCIGRLVKTVARPVHLVKEIMGEMDTYGHKIKSFASDAGVSSSSDFRVMTGEVDVLLRSAGIQIIKADPHNHQNGTSIVERMIQSIKLKMRMAFQYVLKNENITRLKFTKTMLMKMWGEVFYWAIEVENLRISDGNPSKTRKELFTRKKPNIQDVRLLPIFAVVKVYRYGTRDARDGDVNGNFYQYGLYVGPCPFGKGVIRVAILIKNEVFVLRTSKYKGVSDGGDAEEYMHLESGIDRVLNDEIVEDGQVDGISEEKCADGDIQRGSLNTKVSEGSNRTVEDLMTKRFRDKTVDEVQENVEVSRRKKPPEQQKEDEIKKKEHGHFTRSNKTKRTEIVDAGYAEWVIYENGESFIDAITGGVVQIDGSEVEAYVAVKENVPKSLKEALADPIWGEPARKELHTLTNQMMTLIPIRSDDARDLIDEGADKVVLFPIYERKMKEGVEVLKVRLVCNGKTQFGAGNTYSPTPTRVEMFVVLSIVAIFGWKCAHLDEIRAFLSSKYGGNVPVVAMIKGIPGKYRVRGALYGLKTSPRDYRAEVVKRLQIMNFRKLETSQCIFIRGSVIVYEFVDDFVIVGPEVSEIEDAIEEYRMKAETTNPVWDPNELLGHEMVRDRERKVIRLGMKGKILELVKIYGEDKLKKWKTPMGSHQYVVRDEELDALGECGRELGDEERREYQSVVGSLGWFAGVRQDIGFAFQYLSSFGRCPRVHHMRVAERVLGYLWGTCDVTLDLGGEKLDVVAMSDASYGTGKNGRSILGYLVKLGEMSGAVVSKSMVCKYVRMSTFEAELEALTAVSKMVKWIQLLILGMIGVFRQARIWVDNETTINFVNGEVEVRAAKHMEIKMYWVREEIKKGSVRVEYMEGEILPADMLTKVVSSIRFRGFIKDLQGGKIEDYNIMDNLDSDDDMDNNNINIGAGTTLH